MSGIRSEIQDCLVSGFWLAVFTGGISGAATAKLGYGIGAFAIGFLAFGVLPAIHEEGRSRGRREIAALQNQTPESASDYSRDELGKILSGDGDGKAGPQQRNAR
jgi:hypothetical protein